MTPPGEGWHSYRQTDVPRALSYKGHECQDLSLSLLNSESHKPPPSKQTQMATNMIPRGTGVAFHHHHATSMSVPAAHSKVPK